MIEPEVRYLIDRQLEHKGWILDPLHHSQNVFFENAVKTRITKSQKSRLGDKRPDYTLFDSRQPLAILEAKKPEISNLKDALNQARDYAECLDTNVVFALNGKILESIHLVDNQPLKLNGLEITELPSLSLLKKFHNTSDLITIPQQVISSRNDLIQIFSRLNDDLRSIGIRAGIERFSEFANLLFLKLLSENGNSELWDGLLHQSSNTRIQYLREIVVDDLKEQYGGDVLQKPAIKRFRHTRKDHSRTQFSKS